MRTVLSFEEIRSGAVTDVYFERTEAILKAKGLNPRTRAEVFLKHFPYGTFGVLAGMEEALELLAGSMPTWRRFQRGRCSLSASPSSSSMGLI